MAIQSLTPVLTVPNVWQAVEFYQERLGFRCVNQMEGWAAVERDGAEVMFSLPGSHVPFSLPLFTGALYFHTDTVDELWQEHKRKGERPVSR